MPIAMGLRIWIDEGCILCSWCQSLAPEIFIFDGHGTEIRAEVRVDHRRSANRRERSPQCHGSAEEIVARTEVCYRRLHEAGLNIGDHLQTAANLLPLAGTDPDASVTRYRALKSALEAREVTLLPAHYESLSLLTLLDHRPETVVDRMLAVLNELDLLQPEVLISANLAIAADLTILDLMRYDRDLRPLHDAHGAQTMLHNLHVFNLASIAMLGRVSGELAMPAMEALAAEWPPSM